MDLAISLRTEDYTGSFPSLFFPPSMNILALHKQKKVLSRPAMHIGVDWGGCAGVREGAAGIFHHLEIIGGNDKLQRQIKEQDPTL